MAVKITGKLKGNDLIQLANGDNYGESYAVTVNTLKEWLGLSEEKIVENLEGPTMLWTKNEIKEWMKNHKVKFNAGDVKQDLLDKIGG